MGRYDDEDTEDYTPSSSTDETSTEESVDPSTLQAARQVIRGGWDNAETVTDASSPFPQNLKPDESGVLVKFLGSGPYTSYRQHWIQEITEGSKAFTCIADSDPKGCPLCDGGNRASSQYRFNVAVLTEDGSAPALKSYNTGPRNYDSLKGFHTDPRQGPLEKHYWVIKRKKSGNIWSSDFFMVRESELHESGVVAPTQDQLDAITLWDEATVRISSRKELLEVAETYLGLE